MAGELIAHVRRAFGWAGDVEVSAGPRGARGQVWRLTVGGDVFALKETFADPLSEQALRTELAFTRRAAEAGVLLPASHPDRHGSHLVTAPDGTRLRLYDWVDLRAVDPLAPGTPRAIGELLARLHRCAPAAATEPDGTPPSPWYHRVPPSDSWRPAGQWADRLAERLTTLPELCAAVVPPDPADLVLCHRDLHPENVLADPEGRLVVVDWDDLGPADPARELAVVMFDWYCDGPALDRDAARTMYEAYVTAGGPGRITGRQDFSMLVASRLNFLLRQLRIVADPGTAPGDRTWADREIDEALRILPAPAHLTEVLELVGGTRP